jgi:outer membrane protein OmpA-like peptidoglycan-associated protein
MRRAAPWIVLAVLAVGCAKYPQLQQLTRNDLYILLPGAGGAVGALVVSHEGRALTLSQPLAAAKIERAGVIVPTRTTEAEMRQVFGAALTAQPPRPTSFVLYFLLDSDELTAESQRLVANVFGEISRRPAPEIEIIGHTDTMGTEEHNDRLSLQRAERVRSSLIQRGIGIPPGSLHVAGRGKRELLVPTADQVAEPKNRRVELIVR